ncbi:MAG TPA: SUMF1/EgtB/PvdO family nonheme iron enzyme [Polyangiaceae bacterium]|nr:SUMF1/EgtB/PvdO family nonheme iron enzyme [Polyangiaceae bacterium]
MRFGFSSAALLGVVLNCGCSQDEFRTAPTVLGDAGPAQVTPPRTSGEGGVGVARAAQALPDAGAPKHDEATRALARELDARVEPRAGTTEAGSSDAAVADATTQMDASSEPVRPCEDGKAGPPMVSITPPSGPSYCIDTTEVTVSDYAAFLASNPPLSLLPATVCAWKKSFVPDGVFPPAGGADLPVSSVDWCDAAAYCAFAGKHLCGKVGGGSNAYTDFAKPASEWYFACSAGGKTTFPYGSTFDPSACVGVDFDGTSGFQPTTDTPHDVGSATRCHGQTAPFSAIYDMAGNVAEWEDSCDSTGGSADYCHVRGDSYREGNETTMPCGYAPRMTRSYRGGYIGFRCCSEM